jgi:hypothetical protein
MRLIPPHKGLRDFPWYKGETDPMCERVQGVDWMMMMMAVEWDPQMGDLLMMMWWCLVMNGYAC